MTSKPRGVLKTYGSLTGVALVWISLAGCSHNPPEPELPRAPIKEAFTTQISTDGTKFFHYQLEMPSASAPGAGKGRTKSAQKQSERAKPQRAKEKGDYFAAQVQKRFVWQMQETGYCQQGYLLHERYIGRSEASIRGECREGVDQEA